MAHEFRLRTYLHSLDIPNRPSGLAAGASRRGRWIRCHPRGTPKRKQERWADVGTRRGRFRSALFIRCKISKRFEDTLAGRSRTPGEYFFLCKDTEMAPAPSTNGVCARELIACSQSCDRAHLHAATLHPPSRHQPGRVEVALEILRHLERLSLPHHVAEPVAEVSLGARRSLAASRRAHMVAAHGEASFAAGNTPRRTRAPAHATGTRGRGFQPDVSGEKDGIDGLAPSPLRWARANEGAEGARSIAEVPHACDARTPDVPFCVETSPGAFRSFVDLLDYARRGLGGTAGNADRGERNPPVTQGLELGECDLAVIDQRRSGTGDAAEGSASPWGDEPRDSIRGGARKCSGLGPEQADSDALATRRANALLEVLRRSLKLLRINVFFLVRAATIRRAYRAGNDTDGRGLGSVSAHAKGISRKDGVTQGSAPERSSPPDSSTTECRGKGRDGKPDDKKRLKQLRRRPPKSPPLVTGTPGTWRAGTGSATDAETIGGDDDAHHPEKKGVVLESLTRESFPGSRSSGCEQMAGVVEDLHGALWAILDQTTLCGFRGMEQALRNVQVSHGGPETPVACWPSA